MLNKSIIPSGRSITLSLDLIEAFGANAAIILTILLREYEWRKAYMNLAKESFALNLRVLRGETKLTKGILKRSLEKLQKSGILELEKTGAQSKNVKINEEVIKRKFNWNKG